MESLKKRYRYELVDDLLLLHVALHQVSKTGYGPKSITLWQSVFDETSGVSDFPYLLDDLDLRIIQFYETKLRQLLLINSPNANCLRYI